MRLFIILVCFSLLLSIIPQTANNLFGGAVDKGKLSYKAIHEASGLESALNNPGYFWIHNDSGDDARVFLLDSTAQHRATFYLGGVTVHDCEDIASMQEHSNDLLLGDIGDNLAKRSTIQIYRFEEPTVKANNSKVDTIPTKAITTYNLRYEDGPRDAEAFFYDPIAKKIVVISKRELQVGVYEAALPKHAIDTLVLQKKMTIPYTFITSASISADGKEVLIKNLLNVYYWKREMNESLTDMFKRPGTSLPYTAEPQGEAITFARDGSGYYTTSERPFGLAAHLYYYPRKSRTGR